MRFKKGELSSQIFLYFFGILVVILIVFAGYKSISTFSSSAKTSGLRSFQARFDSDMNSLSLHKGEIKKFSYSVPGEYTKFCVFDMYHDLNFDSAIFDFHPLIKGDVKDKVSNAFLINKKGYYAFKTDMVRINNYPYYYCSDIRNGNFEFNAKGIIIDGEASSMIMVINKAGINISNPVISDYIAPSSYKLSSSIELLSSDGLVMMKLPEDTRLTFTSTNTFLSVEILRPGEASETYDFQPSGTTFNPPIQVGIKKSDCMTDFRNYPFSIGGTIVNGVKCENGFIIYNINHI